MPSKSLQSDEGAAFSVLCTTIESSAYHRVEFGVTIQISKQSQDPITISLGQGGSPKGFKHSPEGSEEPWKVFETQVRFLRVSHGCVVGRLEKSRELGKVTF